MQRILTDTGLFRAGDPTKGIPGTIVTAKWLNDIQEELCSILVAAGMDPDGTSQDQLLQALRATFFDNRTGAPILYVQTTPSNKIADIIYVIDKACFMRWQTIGSWTGYASDALMSKVDGTTANPAPNEIDLIGGVYSKSKYPALWAKVQVNDHVVAASAWRDKIFKFIDLGGDTFKVPDLRNTFIRATGFDSDSANARELGSYQGDAIKAHRHGQATGAGRVVDYSGSNAPLTGFGHEVYDASITNKMPVLFDYNGTYDFNKKLWSPLLTSDQDGAATETRGPNTAFHLRLVAY